MSEVYAACIMCSCKVTPLDVSSIVTCQKCGAKMRFGNCSRIMVAKVVIVELSSLEKFRKTIFNDVLLKMYDSVESDVNDLDNKLLNNQVYEFVIKKCYIIC